MMARTNNAVMTIDFFSAACQLWFRKKHPTLKSLYFNEITEMDPFRLCQQLYRIGRVVYQNGKQLL